MWILYWKEGTIIQSINEYLEQLKKELAGSDSATIQDALADAEEHLRTALASAVESQSAVSEIDDLTPVIEKYGFPAEIAKAYREIEVRVQPIFVKLVNTDKRSVLAQFFAVFTDTRAWGALLYLLFSFVTGILYFYQEKIRKRLLIIGDFRFHQAQR